MAFGIWDLIVFIGFVGCVIALGLFKSRDEKTGEDYFLAGRGLKWWLIGFSLIAANISSEQFVGMSGNAASHVGLAIASYEWMAAITLVIIAFAFLPFFLRAGIYTIPEYLEYRYNTGARTIMAIATLFIYMLLLGSVTYSGALTINTMAGKMGYEVSLFSASLVIGVMAMVYVTAGGLKACAWADLLQGSALIVGGGVIAYFAFKMLGNASEAAKVVDISTGEIQLVPLAQGSGSLERFWDLNRVRMNMFLPSNDPVLPWTALLLGLWIPNFYYWGLNQYITQRTLGSKSLAEGQKGIVFAAFLKLLIPFFIVIPGLIAFNLFSKNMQNQSVSDNTSVIVKYLKANPQTQFVQMIPSPTKEQIQTWSPGKFLIAVYPHSKSFSSLKNQNPFVLQITQENFEKLSTPSFSIFDSDDKALKTVFPGFLPELVSFNQQIREKAKLAGAQITQEKFIVYKYDTALGQLLSNVIPPKSGWLGFVLAALLGAIVSSLAAMLNAASTIFTMDVYKKFLRPTAGPEAIVFLGRVSVVIFAVIAVLLAPQLGNPKFSHSIFTIIQESQGLISPGILAVFVFGFLVRKAPPIAGVAGLLTNIIAYGGMYLLGRYKIFPEVQFLNRMAICFILCLTVMSVITFLRPLPQPMEFKKTSSIDLTPSKKSKWFGLLIILLTLVLYIIFSPIGLAK